MYMLWWSLVFDISGISPYLCVGWPDKWVVTQYCNECHLNLRQSKLHSNTIVRVCTKWQVGLPHRLLGLIVTEPRMVKWKLMIRGYQRYRYLQYAIVMIHKNHYMYLCICSVQCIIMLYIYSICHWTVTLGRVHTWSPLRVEHVGLWPAFWVPVN